jgi:hypothetical protein
MQHACIVAAATLLSCKGQRYMAAGPDEIREYGARILKRVRQHQAEEDHAGSPAVLAASILAAATTLSCEPARQELPELDELCQFAHRIYDEWDAAS